ncbi:MAG: peptidoglycan DD-metalloendopeptidase family protein [Gallionella sp.]
MIYKIEIASGRDAVQTRVKKLLWIVGCCALGMGCVAETMPQNQLAATRTQPSQTTAIDIQAAQLYFWDFFTATNSRETVLAYIDREFEEDAHRSAFIAMMRFLVEKNQYLDAETQKTWLKTLDQGVTAAQLAQSLIPLLVSRQHQPVWMMPTDGLLVDALTEDPKRVGVEILGELGQPIVASAAGVVEYSGTSDSGGLIKIKHHANITTTYAYNHQLLVKKGQHVAQGEKIATMGSRREDESAALYFEMQRFGKPVQPMQYLYAPQNIVCSPANAPPAEAPVIDASEDDNLKWVMPTQSKFLTLDPVKIRQNKGVDFLGTLGQPVFAAASGEVAYSDNGLKGYGNLVLIKHNAKYVSVYAHNSVLLVKVGQRVEAGQQIAEMGSTDTNQTRLHFEIRRFGKPVDPSKYLKAE